MAAPKKALAPDARRDMQKELAAASALKHQLAEAFGDEHDLALLRDMVEGETDLHEAIDRVLEQMARDTSNIIGIEKFQTTEAARKKRLEDRVDTLRSMLLNALDILEEKRIERPIALITLKSLPPKLLITDEAAIPTGYFKQPDPVLSKKDLTDALKDRRDTLAQQLAELGEQRALGLIGDADLARMQENLYADHPEIPGAELDNGGATIQLKWS